MPVKRRKDKTRSRAEIDAWGTVFESGIDFFQEVYLLTGVADPTGSSFDPNYAEARAAWNEMAREAWHRLGAQWMAATEYEGDIWALAEFGEPGGLS